LEIEEKQGTVKCKVEAHGEFARALDVSSLSSWWKNQANGNTEAAITLPVNSLAAPPSIDIIPFIVNILPIAMIFDAEIQVDVIDEHFLACIPFIRRRLQSLYPELSLGGTVTSRRREYNHIGQPERGPVALFSGGVDAVFTALANRELEPTLLCVHGADVFFAPNNPWPHVERKVKEFASKVGLNSEFVRSTFRTSLNYAVLDPLLKGFGVKDNWWHALQFGLSLSAIAIPLAFRLRADHILLASDYSNKDSQVNRSGSDTALVQELRAAGILVRCHDFNVSRQQKVAFICDYAKTNRIEIPLRVCWKSSSGENCGICEKCLRTQFAILACGEEPEKFGFSADSSVQDLARQRIRSGEIQMTPFWQDLKRDIYASSMRNHPLSQALLTSKREG
jgi:hypothetical protein